MSSDKMMAEKILGRDGQTVDDRPRPFPPYPRDGGPREYRVNGTRKGDRKGPGLWDLAIMEGRNRDATRERVEKGGEDENKNENENEERGNGWINWERWELSAWFILFNMIFAIPVSYIIAVYAVAQPWGWLGFILCHHALLACGYEVAMNIRDRTIEERITKEAEEQRELEKWDEVVEKLEVLLEQSRKNRLIMEEVEDEVEDAKMELRRKEARECFTGSLARNAIRKKILEMREAKDRGLRIDWGLWGALNSLRCEMSLATGAWKVAPQWKEKSWQELCEAEGIFED